MPQTETQETAQQALDYFYYPQVGKRSWGGASRANVNDHPERLDYANYWNDFGVLWLQIESLSAVTRAKSLAKKGVDCLSWGPADLSFDREANQEHPLKTDDDSIRLSLNCWRGHRQSFVSAVMNRNYVINTWTWVQQF